MKSLIVTIFCLSAFVSSSFAQEKPSEKPIQKEGKKVVKKANERPAEDKAEKEPFDDADVKTMASKCVSLETGKGNIILEMYPESAPEAVRNFLNLVAIGALDTTTFSRVVPNFVIQGGNLYTSEKLTDKLKWRAIETIPDEPNQILHERGIISMARDVTKPDTATTGFFILVAKASTLDGKFAAFGKVIKGMETVETINKMEVENEKPKDPVRIDKATIETCSAAEKTEEESLKPENEKPAKETETREETSDPSN